MSGFRGALLLARNATATIISRYVPQCTPTSMVYRRYASETENEEEEEEEMASGDRAVHPAELPGDRVDDQYMFRLEPTPMPGNKSVRHLWAKISITKFNVVNIIKEWMREQDKQVDRRDLTALISRLRQHGRFTQALQIADWMYEERNTGTADFLMRLYLTSRCGNFQEAERMLANVQVGLQNEMSYTILLSGYTSRLEVKRAELLWRRMKDRDLARRPHGYNNMLIMYKRKKLFGELRRLYVEMVLSRVPQDAITFLVILSTRETLGGFDEVEKKATKAMECLEILNLPWHTMEVMMRVYGYLGDLDGIERVWDKLPKIKSQSTSLSAMEAFGMAGCVARSEKIFTEMNSKVDLQHSYTMIMVYCRAGMAERATDLLKKLIMSGRDPGEFVYNAVIKTLVKQKEVEHAVELLKMAIKRVKRNRMATTLGSSIVAIMDAYTQSGDVGAAEKMVSMCKEANYFAEAKLYNALLKVYLNAQVSATGIEQRFRVHPVKADSDTRQLLLKLGEISQV